MDGLKRKVFLSTLKDDTGRKKKTAEGQDEVDDERRQRRTKKRKNARSHTTQKKSSRKNSGMHGKKVSAGEKGNKKSDDSDESFLGDGPNSVLFW